MNSYFMKSTFNLIILFLGLFFTQKSFSQGINAERILNDSISVLDDAHWHKVKIGDTKKKYIILDFWAIWCKPCIDNHKIIESVYKLHSDSLSILTIAGDRYNDFMSFNKNWKTKLVKSLDTGNTLFKKYNIGLVPTMIFINTENMNIRVISGGLMSDDTFQNFTVSELRKSYNIPTRINPEEVMKRFYNEKSKVSMIREQSYIPNSSSFSYNEFPKNNITFRKVYVNFSIPGLYKDCLDFTEVRSIYDFKEGTDALSCFEVTVINKDKDSIDPNKYLISYLKTNHPGIRAEIINKVVDSCYCLEKADNGKLSITKELITESASRGNLISLKKVSLNKLCNTFEEQLRIPINNDADHENFFDVELSYNHGDIADLDRQLNKLGLKLTLRKNISIKYLIFKKEILNYKS